MTPSCPATAARWSGVELVSVRAFTLAPIDIKVLTVSS